MLATLHAWAATAAAILAALLVVLGLLDGAGVIRARRLLDRLILAALVAMAVAAFIGPLVLLTVRPPSDMLHLLYALVAFLAAPLARLESMRRHSARVGWWIALGGGVTLAALLRLRQTGG